MAIEVFNLHKGKPSGVCEYIGRPRSLGNPFVIGPDGTRDEVIQKYKRRLWREIRQRSGPMYQSLLRLVKQVESGQDVKLLCHCKPLPCHGDVVKAAMEWMIEQGGSSRFGQGRT